MDKENLNVNIFIGSLGGGGAERVVSEIVQNHPQYANISVSLLSQKNNVYQVGDAQQFVYDEISSLNFCSKFLFRIRPKIIYQTYQHYLHLRRNRVDVSVSFLTYTNIINMIVSGLLHIPTVVSIRNNILEEHRFSIILILNKFLLKTCSPYVIVNSEDNKNFLINHYNLDKDKCISIYNPKNISEIQIQSQFPVFDEFFQTDELVLLTVGRLTHQKGHLHLLRVFRYLHAIIPSRLVICGIGPLESQLKEMAEMMNLSDCIYFAGFCENPYKYMRRADVFVFTSLFEGQPNALIEALICGCPIISTDCDYGSREILGNGKYGILTERLDGNIENPLTTPLTNGERDMYNKILFLAQHPCEREKLSSLSLEQISLFDKMKCVKKYYDVFHAASCRESLLNIE